MCRFHFAVNLSHFFIVCQLHETVRSLTYLGRLCIIHLYIVKRLFVQSAGPQKEKKADKKKNKKGARGSRPQSAQRPVSAKAVSKNSEELRGSLKDSTGTGTEQSCASCPNEQNHTSMEHSNTAEVTERFEHSAPSVDQTGDVTVSVGQQIENLSLTAPETGTQSKSEIKSEHETVGSEENNDSNENSGGERQTLAEDKLLATIDVTRQQETKILIESLEVASKMSEGGGGY